ncbi:MAG TPA: HD domain-containing protein, partial [Isosphaeraceae bacterium]|nr:HD domain-containing protein [Isosphaeraceae bacterium]
MAGTDTAVVRLSDLTDGQTAECFGALVKKVRGATYKNEPFIKCYFRDKRVTLEAPIWHNHPFHQQAAEWLEGVAYRLRVRGELKPRYGLQIEILDIRPVAHEDVADGYDFYDLVESTDYCPDQLLQTIHDIINKYIDNRYLNQLVRQVLLEHGEMFKKMQAAQNFHHSYTGGLLEHVWSMTRISGFLADHYAKYYDKLNPPLNKGVIVAAAILHDIGKLRELEYHPVEAKYTKHGSLIGHVLMGRDMVREAARQITDFPEETLLLLEHAILAHHGRTEFGAPIVPKTLEALIVSFVDDL